MSKMSNILWFIVIVVIIMLLCLYYWKGIDDIDRKQRIVHPTSITINVI